MPCWLHEQKLRKFNSKDFASDERKLEIEIVNYSVSHKKMATMCNKIKGETAPYGNKFKFRIGDGKNFDIPAK